MPIIATAFIPINISRDTIEIVRLEVNKCGCVSTDSLAIQTGRPVDDIRDALRILAGEGKVTCDSSTEICCADKERLEEFSEKLRRMRGGV